MCSQYLIDCEDSCDTFVRTKSGPRSGQLKNKKLYLNTDRCQDDDSTSQYHDEISGGLSQTQVSSTFAGEISPLKRFDYNNDKTNKNTRHNSSTNY